MPEVIAFDRKRWFPQKWADRAARLRKRTALAAERIV